MCRTKFIVVSSQRYGLGSFAKCKRHQIKQVKRSVQHSLRISNKYADELRFLTLKNYIKRKYYKSYQLEKEVLGRRLDQYHQYLFKPYDQLQDSMRKRLQQSLRGLKRDQSTNPRLWAKAPRRVSDIFIAAHKKLKRRGNLLPFTGHREKGVLYKRELAYWL